MESAAAPDGAFLQRLRDAAVEAAQEAGKLMLSSYDHVAVEASKASHQDLVTVVGESSLSMAAQSDLISKPGYGRSN